MSDQETAIQLIRNEAAELVTRAKAAGLSVLVFNGPDGAIVDVLPLKPEPRIRVFAADKIESAQVEEGPEQLDGTLLTTRGYILRNFPVPPLPPGMPVQGCPDCNTEEVVS